LIKILGQVACLIAAAGKLAMLRMHTWTKTDEGERLMDSERARSLLIAERDEVQGLLKGTEAESREARGAEVDSEVGDTGDAAQSLTAEGMDDAIAESLRNRLDVIERALQRLDEGTYGRSVQSGDPIPDERLEADPAAELTIEEARAAERS
jgi:DnaK suppressor protein